jgi:hypothetical protein
MKRFKNFKLVVVHYQAPEHYPPLINLCNFFATKFTEDNFRVVTNGLEDSQIKIKRNQKYFDRMVNFTKSAGRVVRLLRTLKFNIKAFLRLMVYKPENVMYYETCSAFPVFLYIFFFNRKSRLFIHYHEYTSIQQYREGMVLDKIWLYLEKNFLFKKAYWISHTNQFRVDLFLKDYPFIEKSKMRLMPNYPELSWINKTDNKPSIIEKKPIKMVQVGALSFQNMFAKELFDWIKSRGGAFTLDIYSFSISSEISEYLKRTENPYVFPKGPINYEELPTILPQYDIGVVLYKPYSENIIYCAANKLFEYLAFNLDVWVADNMLGAYPHRKEESYPKVCLVSFSNMQNFNWEAAINREGLPFSQPNYNMEDVYQHLEAELKD